MARWTPDPSFYPSPRLAMEAPPEELAYVALLNPDASDGRPDAIGVLDLEDGSSTFGELVGKLDMPNAGDELHHFGWNACSASLCPWAPHPHVERRYLVVPGLRSSRIHVVDVGDDPRAPTIAKVIESDELIHKTGYSRPHTSHCGPEGIYMSALGGAENGGGPGGIFLLDCESFDLRGAWEVDRGPQHFSYDFWWHLGYDTLISSEWGTPDMFEAGSFRRSSSDASTDTTCTSGTCATAGTGRPSISATSTRWCSSCGQLTTRAGPTASLESWCRSRT